MWLWQQQRLAKRTKFLGKLLFLSFVFHSIGAFFLLFMYKGDALSTLHISSAQSQQVIIRVMPLTGLSKKINQKAITRKTYATSTQKVVAQTKKTIVKKEPVKKNIVKKKAASVTQKKEIKKVVPKKVMEQKKTQPIKELKKVEPQPIKKSVDPVKKASQDNQIEDVKYVSQKEYNAFMAQAEFQEAIIEVWTPPAGMSDSLVCTVALSVDWKGNLQHHSVQDSSGVLVYDIAVEQALEKVKIPHSLWGKSVTIAFKP